MPEDVSLLATYPNENVPLTVAFCFADAMGCFGSKDKLSKEDMDFLKSHTRYDEATIKEWYKGFKVSASAPCRRQSANDISRRVRGGRPTIPARK